MTDDHASHGVNARLTRNVVRRNLSTVGLSYAAGSVAGFATQSVLGHRLGSTTYGVYVTGLALATTLSIVQEVAGPAWLVRTAVQQPGSFASLAGAVLALRGAAGVAVVVLATAVAAALHLGSTGIAVAAVLAVVAGVNAVLRALRAGLQAAERMPLSATLATINSVLTAMVMIAIVVSGAGLLAACIGSAVVSVAVLPLSWRLLDPQLRPRLTLQVRALAAAAVRSTPFTVVAMLTTVLNYGDSLVIRGVIGARATGLYGAGWRLLMVLQWVPSIMLDSLMRGMADLAVRDRPRFCRLVDAATSALLVLGLPIAAAGTLIAAPVYQLVFGSSFSGGAHAFAILLWLVPVTFPGLMLVEAALVSGRAAAMGWVLAVLVVVNLATDAALVGRFGIDAAAWVALATGAAMLVAAVVLLATCGVRPEWMRSIAPAIVVSGITAAAVAPLRHDPLALPLLAGSAAFAVATLLLWWVARRSAWGRHWLPLVGEPW